jgi:polyphosphate kinase 2 (PPK2 family)
MMGFVSENGGGALLNVFPEIEKYITDAIVIVIKFWLEVGHEEQT